MIMKSMDDRGIHRLLLIAECYRHAILWYNHQGSNKDKMTENADPDRKSEWTPTSSTSTSSAQDNNDYKRISNAI